MTTDADQAIMEEMAEVEALLQQNPEDPAEQERLVTRWSGNGAVGKGASRPSGKVPSNNKNGRN